MFERIRARSLKSSVTQTVIYSVCRLIARAVIKTFFGAKVVGVENVPAEGPLLIVSNHQSYLDPPIIGAFIGQRQVAFVARQGLFKSKVFSWLISALNAIPIREDGQSDTTAIKTSLSILARGHALVIFPEGQRTNNGALRPFKRGTALLLKRAKCDVLPVAVEGIFDAWKPGAKPSPFSCPIMAKYGRPIPYDELVKDGAEAGMIRLAREIDTMRRELRATIRERTNGRYPASGPGDNALDLPDSPKDALPDARPAPAASDTLTA
jgi:1-acyl-sn-glycerol-3-phosphate acyltransferase